MRVGTLDFREVWVADFEFTTPLGERPQPICLVARELSSGCTIALWEDDLRQHVRPPYSTASDVLVVARAHPISLDSGLE